jgi:hypothetical protein
MSFNWSQVGTTLSGVVTSLGAAGIAPGSTSFNSILASIGLGQNPNESAELALCSSIMVAQGNPMLVSALTQKLATEQGIPPAAATLAMTLLTPGANIPQIVIEIETIIKNGG